MINKYIEAFEKAQIAEKTHPLFKAGDSLSVAIKIKEGEKSRIQHFEGVCISLRGRGTGKTFTVRKTGANGIGVERVFPIFSESIEEIKVTRRGKVRRAKLYYLRNRQGKKARITEDRKRSIK